MTGGCREVVARRNRKRACQVIESAGETLRSLQVNGLRDDSLLSDLRAVEMVAIDLDGTLLTSDKCITRRTENAIKAAAAAGIEIVPATGRVVSVLPSRLVDLHRIRYAVCSAGASVEEVEFSSDCPRTLHEVGFDPMRAAELVEFLEHRCGDWIAADAGYRGELYMSRAALARVREFQLPCERIDFIARSRRPVDDLARTLRGFDGPVGRINLFVRTERARHAIMTWLNRELKVELANSLSDNIELNAPGTSKWNGLVWLTKMLGRSSEHVLVLGDGENDMDMLRRASVGVAMANAPREVRACARATTAQTNDDEGVARVLEELVRIRQRKEGSSGVCVG